MADESRVSGVEGVGDDGGEVGVGGGVDWDGGDEGHEEREEGGEELGMG